MAQRGKPSIAHEYNEQGACIHCGMYESNVNKLVHACKAQRELEVDIREARAQKLSLEEYRRGE